MERRDIRSAGVAELAVYLVGEQEQVVFEHQVADLEHFFHRIQVSGRVVGVADEDTFGAGSDELLEFLYRRQLEAFVDRGGDSDDFCSGRYSECHIVGISRFWNDDFIAGIEAGHECEEHGLAASGGDDDIVDVHVDIETLVVLLEFFTERQQAFRWAVLQNLAVYVFEGVESGLRSGQIGLPDIEPVHFDSTVHCLDGQRHQTTDWGSGHYVAPLRYLWHISRFVSSAKMRKIYGIRKFLANFVD